MPLGQFIALIKVCLSVKLSRTSCICLHFKAPGGSQDGADRYPGNFTDCPDVPSPHNQIVKQVFSVSPNSTLSHVIQKLLASM